jgi:hypothetical protein
VILFELAIPARIDAVEASCAALINVVVAAAVALVIVIVVSDAPSPAALRPATTKVAAFVCDDDSEGIATENVTAVAAVTVVPVVETSPYDEPFQPVIAPRVSFTTAV